MSEDDPLVIVDCFRRHQVDIVIIGGHAVNFHGYARATEDVDVLVQVTDAAEQKLVNALVELEAFYIGAEIDPSTGIEKTHPVDLAYVQTRQLMMLGTKLGYLDIFRFIPGFPLTPLAEVFETAEKHQDRHFVSLAWLRRMKEASGRPADLRDLENLPMA